MRGFGFGILMGKQLFPIEGTKQPETEKLRQKRYLPGKGVLWKFHWKQSETYGVSGYKQQGVLKGQTQGIESGSNVLFRSQDAVCEEGKEPAQ